MGRRLFEDDGHQVVHSKHVFLQVLVVLQVLYCHHVLTGFVTIYPATMARSAGPVRPVRPVSPTVAELRPLQLKGEVARHVADDPDALVFTGPTGAPLRRGNFNKLAKWREAVTRIGAPSLHFHDLRHTGNTLAAVTKASTKDLMARMGHDSINAAIIYQHATNEAGQAIADALDAVLRSREKTQGDHPSGADDDGRWSGGSARSGGLTAWLLYEPARKSREWPRPDDWPGPFSLLCKGFSGWSG